MRTPKVATKILNVKFNVINDLKLKLVILTEKFDSTVICSRPYEAETSQYKRTSEMAMKNPVTLNTENTENQVITTRSCGPGPKPVSRDTNLPKFRFNGKVTREKGQKQDSSTSTVFG